MDVIDKDLPVCHDHRVAGVIEISATELANQIKAGAFEDTLFDVRTPGEYEVARIAGGRLLDEELVAHIETLDRETPLVFF